MNIQEFILKCKETLVELEKLELYERCADLLKLINAIESNDTTTYIKMTFDIKGLKGEGFFKKDATIEEIEARIKHFFSIESVFEYSLIGGGMLNTYYESDYE